MINDQIANLLFVYIFRTYTFCFSRASVCQVIKHYKCQSNVYLGIYDTQIIPDFI